MNDTALVIALLDLSHLEYFALEWHDNKWSVNLAGTWNTKDYDNLHDAVAEAVDHYHKTEL
jgi:hypothetical protein